jgi:ketosteroid isomerase-like protein
MAERVYIKSTLAAVVLLAAAGWTASASAGDESPAANAATTPAADKAAITSVLSAYEAALNASDTDAIGRLYADDVVLMRPFRPSVVGKAAVRQPSVVGSRVSKLNIKFTIAEIVEMAPDWAFARTNSAGTITVTATGATSPEANQELFIFRKDAVGAWKIARYSFSPTIPRPQ